MINTGAEDTESTDHIATTGNYENGGLMWVKGKINNQYLDMMVDSGASMSCIASRCVNASPYLKNLARLSYSGPCLVDLNGKPFKTLFEIEASLVIGLSQSCIDVKLVVVDDLPIDVK